MISINAMVSKNIETPWSFRDGRDYVISLIVAENASSFCIKVSDKITAEEWSGGYDAKYIENLTQRTGSYKSFDVFISMIKFAILKKSDSVALELMNLEDLEQLRSQRSKSLCNNSSSSMAVKASGENVNDNPNKRYLIVTYIAEFDRVHYPIPLNHSGPPDPQLMQTSIKKLRSEVTSLRNAKVILEDELITLKNAQPIITSSSKCDAQVGDDIPYRDKLSTQVEESHEISQLNLMIQKLEQNLRARDEKLEKQQDLLEKVQNENNFLREKLHSAEKYEKQMEDEIYQLQTSLSRKDPRRMLDSDREEGSIDSDFLENHRVVRSRSTKSMDLPWGQKKSRETLINRKCNTEIHNNIGSSSNPAKIKRNPTPFRARSFSRSPSPRPKFDPTAYVNDKKLKQQRMAELRLAKVQSQLRESLSSSSSVRSRSNSQTRFRSNTSSLVCDKCNIRNCQCVREAENYSNLRRQSSPSILNPRMRHNTPINQYTTSSVTLQRSDSKEIIPIFPIRRRHCQSDTLKNRTNSHQSRPVISRRRRNQSPSLSTTTYKGLADLTYGRVGLNKGRKEYDKEIYNRKDLTQILEDCSKHLMK